MAVAVVTIGYFVLRDSSDISAKTIKIGVIAPMTGELAFMGEGIRDAILIAEENMGNTKNRYEVIFEDDQLDAKMSASAAKKLLSADKVDAFVTFSSVTGNVVAPIAEQDENGIFGSSFENLGQDKRLRILKTFGHVTEAQYNNFDLIRKSRKPYLHLWTTDLKNEQADALDVFKKSFQLFKEVTGIGLADDGTVKVNPLLMKLFENQEAKS